jgi:hypothetical protein
MRFIFGAAQTLSGNTLVFALALWVIFALLGYRISWRHQALRGVTPWNFPSFFWALICFIFGPIGLAVELIAEFTTKPRLPSSLGRLSFRDVSARLGLRDQRSPTVVGTTDTGASQTEIGVRTEAPPLPGASIPMLEPLHLGPPPPLDDSGKTAAFGWYPDPLKRHEQRYFDGKGWSAFVRDNGVRANDALNF